MKNYSSKLTKPTPVCCICKIPTAVIDTFVEKNLSIILKRGKEKEAVFTHGNFS